MTAQATLQMLGRKGAVIGAVWIGFTAILAVWAPLLANSRPLAWKVDDPDLGTGWRFPLFELFTPQDVLFIAGFFMLLVCLACYRAGGRVAWVWLSTMCMVFVGSMVFYLMQQHQSLSGAIDSARSIYQKTPSDANLKGINSARWELALWWLQWCVIGAAILGLIAYALNRLRGHLPLFLLALGLGVGGFGLLMIPALRIEPPRIDIPSDDFYRTALADGRAEKAIFPLIPFSPNDTIVDQTSVDAKKLQVGVRNTLKPPGQHPTTPDIVREMSKQAEDLYGIRLYEFDNEREEGALIPETLDDAREARELLWQAKQAEPDYDAVSDKAMHERVGLLYAEFEKIEPETRLHLMGTTDSGQDLASRMVHGSRIALYIGFISTGIAVFIGIFIGGLLGYFAGIVDLIGLRLVEIFASIPVIMLLIMIVAFYERSLVLMMVVLGLTGWVGYAYFVRAEFLKLRKMDYVIAARAAGTPLHRILFRHMLPNGVAPVLVGASFGIAGAIMTEATLSFLGLGLEPTEPSWGQMLDQARQGGSFSWWLAIYPGLAIFLTVFAYNLIGEALRDVIDPRTAK